jgi:hypothetical protein
VYWSLRLLTFELSCPLVLKESTEPDNLKAKSCAEVFLAACDIRNIEPWTVVTNIQLTQVTEELLDTDTGNSNPMTRKKGSSRHL